MAAVVATVPETAPVAVVPVTLSGVAELAACAFCACSAAIRLCMKADIACNGSCVEEALLDVLPAVVAPALVAALVALGALTPPNWDSAWKIAPNRPLPDALLPLAEVVLLAAPVWLVVLDWFVGLSQ